jgi:hypothetical protein
MADNALLKILSSRIMPSGIARMVLRGFAHFHSARSKGKPAGAGDGFRLKSPVCIMEGYHGGVLYWDWLILRKGGFWESLVWPAVGEALLYRAGRQDIPIVLELDAPTFRHMAQKQRKPFSRLKG